MLPIFEHVLLNISKSLVDSSDWTYILQVVFTKSLVRNKYVLSTCTKYTYFLKKVQYTVLWQKYSTVQNVLLKKYSACHEFSMYFFKISEIRSFGMATPTEMIGPTKLEFWKIEVLIIRSQNQKNNIWNFLERNQLRNQNVYFSFCLISSVSTHFEWKMVKSGKQGLHH